MLKLLGLDSIQFLCQLAHVAITEYHKVDDLSNKNVFSSSSGSWESRIKVLAGLISGETVLPGFQIVVFSLCPSIAFSLCTHTSSVSSLSYKDTSPIRLGFHPYDLI